VGSKITIHDIQCGHHGATKIRLTIHSLPYWGSVEEGLSSTTNKCSGLNPSGVFRYAPPMVIHFVLCHSYHLSFIDLRP
jgi:hypothetical protein